MDKQQLMETWFTGKLSDEERQHLNDLLATDPEFREEFDFQMEVRQAIREEERQTLKSRLKSLDETVRPSGNKWWYAAAGIVILLGLGWLFFPSQPDYRELYVLNFEPYPNLISPVVRNGDSVTDIQLNQAFQWYDAGEYEKASGAFQAIHEHTGEDYAWFYRSVSELAAGNDQKAVYLLEQYNWQEPERYENISSWYLGLAYLRQERRDDAVKYFEKVSSSGGELHRQAALVLEEIR